VLGSSSTGSSDTACCNVIDVLLLVTLHNRYVITTHTSNNTTLKVTSNTNKSPTYPGTEAIETYIDKQKICENASDNGLQRPFNYECKYSKMTLITEKPASIDGLHVAQSKAMKQHSVDMLPCCVF